jgi:hypothetical protein
LCVHEYHESYHGINKGQEAHKAAYEKEGVYWHGHQLSAALPVKVPDITYRTSKEVKDTGLEHIVNTTVHESVCLCMCFACGIRMSCCVASFSTL